MALSPAEVEQINRLIEAGVQLQTATLILVLGRTSHNLARLVDDFLKAWSSDMVVHSYDRGPIPNGS